MNNTDLNNLQNYEEYLDFLSSKYIDAELSLEEDNMLRNLINENPNLKENFFNNIDIYQSIKEESKNIEIPLEFLDETENLLVDKLFNKDSVLSSQKSNLTLEYSKFSNYDFQIDELELLENDGNYFNNQNSKTTFINLTTNKSNKVFNRLTLVAACFLLFFVYNINEFRNTNQINSFVDLNFEINLENELNSNTKINTNKSDNSIQSQISKANQLNSNLTIAKDIDNSKLIIDQSEKSIIEDNQNSLIDNDKSINSTITENSLANIENINTENINIENVNKLNETIKQSENFIINSSKSTNVSLYNNKDINSLSKNNISNNSFVYDKENISTTFKFNSSISNDLGNSRFNSQNNAITSHYAQSIAIQIDDNNDLGFEFGFSDFNFDDKANLSITTEIPNNTPGSNLKEYRTIIVPVELRKNYTMYWALGFIEKNIFKYNDFTINTKFALGFSNDGPQSYLRMSAKYELLKNLNLNFGLDGRYMNVNLPFYINANNSNTTTALSLNYGIQYQF